MIKKLIALLILASVTLQACNIGCSKCDKSSNQCVICDIRSNYYLFNGGCLKLSLSNCATYVQSGQCLQCSKDYYLDVNTSTCVPLSDNNKIAGCKFYNSAKACVRCEDGFYVTGTSCSSVTSVIANCDNYSSDGSCAKCISGYIFSADRLSCVAKPTTVSLCAGFNAVQCVQCANGYYQNPNLYLANFYNQTPNTVILSTSEILDKGNLAEWTTAPICQRVADQNCLVANSLTTCQTCNAGYFVNASGRCEQILSTLPNCVTKQSTNNDCLVCTSAYFSNSSKVCTLRTILTCLTYDTSADRCLTCTSNRYLDANNICQLRTVNTCLTYNLNSDSCVTCNVSLNYLNASNVCVARTVLNCLTFNPTANNCLSCNVSLHYFSNNLCNTRTVTTCLTYNANTDTCATCNQVSYYMNASNVCVARTIVNCSTFNPTANQCVTCSSTRYLNASFDCITRTQPNCATTVVSADQCATCSPNYYLNNGACPANTASNCLTKSTVANLCVACVSTAYLDPADNLCKPYTVSNCAAKNPSADACVGCIADYYASGNNCLQNTSINCAVKSTTANSCTTCVANTYRDGSNNCQLYTVSNCATKSSNSNACLTCNTGYWLNGVDCSVNDSTNCASKSQSANTCTTCNTGYYVVNAHDCALISVANCKTLHATLNQCVTCNDFYYVNALNTCTANPDAVLHCVVYTSATTCGKCADPYLLASPTSCVLIPENQKILNCATYRTDISTVQCTQCISGYYVNNNNGCSVRVFSANIPNCSAVNLLADQCLTCANTYRLTDDKLKCLSVVGNCNFYASSSINTASLTCTLCNNGYYLQSSSQCTLGDSTKNCLAFKTYIDCISCQPDYYLFGVTCILQTASIANCATRSVTAQNECGVCNVGYHPFKILYGCVAATVVANCSDYNSSAVCTACNTGYYLTNANQCTSLPANCKRASGLGVCLECQTGYFRDSTNACFAAFRYITTNCDTLNTNLSYTFGQDTSDACSICNAVAIRQSIGGASMCVQGTVVGSLGVSGGAVVANCKRYSNSNSLFCMECDSGYHLSDMKASNPTCVANATPCAATQVLLLDNLDGKIFGCISPTSSMNCQVAARIQVAGEDPNCFACLQVQTSYLPVITLYSEDITTIAYEYNASNTYANWNTYPSKVFYQGYNVRAYAYTISTNLHTTGTCELYFETAGYFVCYRGSFGTAVTYTGSGSGAASAAASIAGCNTGVVYTGFPSYLTAVLSCHACTNSSFKPSVYIQLYSDSSSVWSGIRSGAASVTCEAPLVAVTNCAVYGKLFDSSGNVSSACLACMPGYKPTSVSANKSVASCVAIPDCNLASASNTIANKCGQCATTNAAGKPMGYISSDMTSCVPTITSNCFITSNVLNSSSVYDCIRCKAGFFLNADKQCEALVLAGCSDSSSTIFGSVNTANFIEYHLLKASAAKGINGCNACTEGTDNLVHVNANEKQCIVSSYVVGNSYVASTVYIANCSKYLNYYSSGSTPAFKCNSCISGYTVTADNLRCVAAISNCVAANSITNTKCFTCANSYINVNGVCESPTITNCATYADTSNGISQICSQCNNGYSKMNSGSTCTAGSVANCKTYTDGSITDCTACQSNFGLTTLANNAKMCVDLNSATTKCVEANSSSLNISGYQCSKCYFDTTSVFAVTQISSFASYPNIPLSVCFAHPTTANCNSYDGNNLVMKANTFNCSACNSASLFVRSSDNTCVSRTIRANCATYSSGADTCATCAANYWVSGDGNTCNAYPASVLNCRVYSNSSTCTTCEANYYISGNACLPVTNIVANCLTYSSSTVCSACQPQYLLNSGSNVCDKITASNCLTYTNYYQCATCNSGYRVKAGTGSIIDCVVVDVQYCATQTGSWPYCSSCTAGYFVNPATSFCAAPTPISGCTTYASYSTCSACSYPKFPSPSGNACVLPNVPNCATFASLTTCSVCTLPYFVNPSNTCSIPSIVGCTTYSSYGVCTACSGTNYFPSVNGSSCVYAQSISNCVSYSNLTTCQTCKPNYWLENNLCNVQQIIVDCLTYASSTTCATCIAGKFPSGTLCSVPTSVSNCSFYDSPTTCQTCSNGYFLAGNKLSCTLITVVANCATYSSPTICSACNSGYMMNGNTCPQIVAIANCATWSSYNTCSQCQTGYMLTNNACPQIVAIPNCTQWSAYNTCSQCDIGRMLFNNTCPMRVAISGCITWSAYNTCSACSANLYLYQNRCTPGDVVNCLAHDSAITCTKCATGFVLSVNRQVCSASYAAFNDANCANSKLIAQASCTMCSPGYYFAADGSCTSCLSNSFAAGCLNCDPNNQSVCFMCKPGYSHNLDGTCVDNNSLVVNTNSANQNTLPALTVTGIASNVEPATTSAPAITSSVNNTLNSSSSTNSTTNTTNTTNTTSNQNNNNTVKQAFISGAIQLMSVLLMLLISKN